jgi:uncharacterized protein (DUF58 family)
MSIIWIILTTLLVIGFQSYIFSKWGLTRIEYTRSFNKDAVFPRENFEMIDEISNNKLLPLPWVRLETRIDGNLQFFKNREESMDENSEEYHRTLFSFAPYQKITRKHKVSCRKRGYYRLKTVSITLGDVMGINNRSESVQAEVAVTVYPELISIEEIPLPSHSWLGEVLVKRWIIEDPFLNAGVRQYAHGDSLNLINWKATARTGSLQVSKKEYTADHNLMIYLNFDETDDIWMPILNQELIEKGISYAASIAQMAISKGVSTGFGCNSYLYDPDGSTPTIKKTVRIKPQNGNHQLAFIYETMARLEMDRSMNFNRFLQEDINKLIKTDVLIISLILTPAIKETIAAIENQGNQVEIIMLNNEQERR